MNKDAFERGFLKAAMRNGVDLLTATQLLKTADGHLGLDATVAGLGGAGGAVSGAGAGVIPGAILGLLYKSYGESQKPKNKRDWGQALGSGAGKGALYGAGIGAGLGGLVGSVKGFEAAEERQMMMEDVASTHVY